MRTDEGVARSDILEARRTGYLSREQAREAIDSLGQGQGIETVRNDLYRAGADGEVAGDIGEVVSPAVLCAVAALRTAHRLVTV